MRRNAVLAVRWGLLAAALLLLVVGLLKQEQVEVMQKAVKLCLECIGIG